MLSPACNLRHHGTGEQKEGLAETVCCGLSREKALRAERHILGAKGGPVGRALQDSKGNIGRYNASNCTP